MLLSSWLTGLQQLRCPSEKGSSQLCAANYHKIITKLWFTAEKNPKPTNLILLACSTHRTGNIMTFRRCPTSQFTGTKCYLNSICAGDTANTDRKLTENTDAGQRATPSHFYGYIMHCIILNHIFILLCNLLHSFNQSALQVARQALEMTSEPAEACMTSSRGTSSQGTF